MKISVDSAIFDKIPLLHSNFILVENMLFKNQKAPELYDGLNEVFSMLRGHKSLDEHEKIVKYEKVLSPGFSLSGEYPRKIFLPNIYSLFKNICENLSVAPGNTVLSRMIS